MFKFFILPLLVVAAIACAWFWLAWHWSYSSGERAGWVQKLSNKGWLCKTWEGELALVSLPGSVAEKFYFTIHNDAVAEKVSKNIGKRVSLQYEEKMGLPTSCFGDTRHFVTGVSVPDEVPAVPAPAPAPAPTVSAPAAVPAATPAVAPIAPAPAPVAVQPAALPAAPAVVAVPTAPTAPAVPAVVAPTTPR